MTDTTDRETLAIFAELVEAKSFAEASRRLNMPTILLSQRLAELEDHIGAPLLLRSTPNFQLTDVGATGA